MSFSRPLRHKVTLCLLAIASLLSIARASAAEATAMGQVENALMRHGGSKQFFEHGFSMKLEGFFDLSARMQGRDSSPEPKPITEHISFDPDTGTVAYDIDWYNYTRSHQQLREIHFPDGRMLFIDHRTRSGGYLPFLQSKDAARRFLRFLPNLLLQDALDHRESIALVKSQHRSVPLVRFRTGSGEHIDLEFDPASGLLIAAATEIDMPVLGKSRIRWSWSGYRPAGTAVLPTELSVSLAGRLMKAVNVSVTPGPSRDIHAAPDGYQVWPAREDLRPVTELQSHGARDPDIEEIDDGVYLVRNLRPGFHAMFVEFDEFVAAVDAPTFWYEMQQLPPFNWSRGDDIAALGRKLVRAIESAAPGKPLRYLVLTHHHSDHIGGYRPLVEAGATILAGASAAQLLRDADKKLASKIENVRGARSITGPGNEIRLIELPDDNPKARNYLAVYLPVQKLLFTSAFVYPVPEEDFPVPESVELSKYFVDWLDGSGLDVASHFNVHANGRVEPWQIDRIRKLTCDDFSCD